MISLKKYRQEVESKSNLLPLLSFSDEDSSFPKLCSLCADFKIRARASHNDEAMLMVNIYADHTTHEAYADVYPDFPEMENRAADGCNFCGFLRNSLQAERRKLRPGVHVRSQPVWVIIDFKVNEIMDDESTLSMYRSNEPHAIQVQLRTRQLGNGGELKQKASKMEEYIGDSMLEHVNDYEIALQFSSGT